MALRAEELRFKGQKRKKNGQFDFDDSIRKYKKSQNSLTKGGNSVKLDKKDVRSSTRSVLLQMRSILALSEMSIRSIKKIFKEEKVYVLFGGA